MPRSEDFADQLVDAIRERGTPAVVALDPVYKHLPAELRGGAAAGARIPSRTEPSRESHPAPNDELAAILEFSRRVIRLIALIVPAVKINSAYFEIYQSAGIDAYYQLVRAARQAGLLVIGDVKRGDVGHSAEMYAAAHLSDGAVSRFGGEQNPDAITVSGSLGSDAVKPFIDVARAEGKGLFVLVRTSNPSAASLQDAMLADGRKLHELLAGQVAEWAADTSLLGEHGFSSIGAVVATRDPADAAKLRAAMPRCIFLVPGYGAQGGRAEDFRPYLRADGLGAVIAAGRSIIFAHEDAEYREQFADRWEKCIEAACRRFAEDLRRLTPAAWQ